jgi:hypothetical protein
MHFNGAKHKKAEKAAGGTTLAGMWKVPAPVIVPIPPPGISRVKVANLSTFLCFKVFESYVKFEVFTVVTMKNGVFWDGISSQCASVASSSLCCS